MSEPASLVYVFVRGVPAPQGSKAYKGKSRAGRAILVESSKRVRPWRAAIAEQAAAVHAPLIPGPVTVVLDFLVPRPKGHQGSGRNAGSLRPGAPAYPVTRSSGDLDKLSRAVLDGVTGVLIDDDSLVVDLHATKRYAPLTGAPGVGITITHLHP